MAIALMDYTPEDPENDQELSMKEGDEIKVFKQDDSGWWHVSIRDQVGWVPSDFVELLSERTLRPAAAKGGDPIASMPVVDAGTSASASTNTNNNAPAAGRQSNASATGNGSNANNNTNAAANANKGNTAPVAAAGPKKGPPAPSGPRNEHLGLLRKEGRPNKFAQRFFVLDKTTKMLTWYKTPKRGKVRGSVSLEVATVAPSHKRPGAFFVRIPERAILLWPQSTEERDRWIAAIQETVDVLYKYADFLPLF